MSGTTPIRDPQSDHLLTAQKAVITFIDYQPGQYAGVHSMAHDAAIQRMTQAAATPISVIGLTGELQRDWGHTGADRLQKILREHFTGHHEPRQQR